MDQESYFQHSDTLTVQVYGNERAILQARATRERLQAALTNKSLKQTVRGEIESQIKELDRHISGWVAMNERIVRELRDTHAKAVQERTRIISASNRERDSYPARMQVVIKVGNTSYTRHLKRKSGGVYIGRGVGLAGMMETWFEYQPYSQSSEVETEAA